MCTLTHSSKLSIAKENITCYKVIRKNDTYRCSPLQRKIIPDYCFIDREKREVYMAEGEPILKFNNFGAEFNNANYTAGYGFIHCMKNEADAMKYLKEMMNKKNLELWQVTVPKGTEYVEGLNLWSSSRKEHYLNNLPAIAAHEIIFEKRIPINKFTKENKEAIKIIQSYTGIKCPRFTFTKEGLVKLFRYVYDNGQKVLTKSCFDLLVVTLKDMLFQMEAIKAEDMENPYCDLPHYLK